MINWILGSNSPRRKELLSALGFEFEVRVKNTDESYPNEMPVENIATFLAHKKALAFKNELKPNEVVICADTTVVFENQLLEKPIDQEQAKSMLTQLSGNTHQVITGVCILGNEHEITFSEKTEVTFATLSTTEIEHYINLYQPFDKAGSYGIQEWIGMMGISNINGTYTNVMGLPTHRLYMEMRKID